MEKERRVNEFLRGLPGAVVGFSGGVDSTLLAVLAHRVLGGRMVAVTARSESLSRRAFEAACGLAGRLGFPHRVIETREIANPDYVKNSSERCFFCKEELSRKLWDVAREERFGAVLLGVIADDAGDFRPGIAAARQENALFPLMECAVTKEEVRAWARRLELPNWDQPAEACLASRLSYGERVTVGKLSAVEQAEEIVRDAARVRRVRVRVHGKLARIEVDEADLAQLLAVRQRVDEGLRRLGYRYVTLDLVGYRTGSMNEGLRSAGENSPRQG